MAPAGPLGQRKLRRATVSRATSSKVGGELLKNEKKSPWDGQDWMMAWLPDMDVSFNGGTPKTPQYDLF